MPQDFLTGKDGFVNTGGVNYSFGKWKWSAKAKMVPRPNFNGGGFEQYVVGLLGGKITISGPYDSGNMPFAVGAQYNWTLGLAVSVFLTVPGILEGIEVDEDVEDGPMVNLTVQSNGAFTAAIV